MPGVEPLDPVQKKVRNAVIRMKRCGIPRIKRGRMLTLCLLAYSKAIEVEGEGGAGERPSLSRSSGRDSEGARGAEFVLSYSTDAHHPFLLFFVLFWWTFISGMPVFLALVFKLHILSPSTTIEFLSWGGV